MSPDMMVQARAAARVKLVWPGGNGGDTSEVA